MRYTYRHRVLLNETNSMGAVVYFSNFVKWQGMVRESALVDNLKYEELISRPIDMITHSCAVEFKGHLFFGDIVRIEMFAKNIMPTSLVLEFQYYNDKTNSLVGEGRQKVTFADRVTGQLCKVPTEIAELAKSIAG